MGRHFGTHISWALFAEAEGVNACSPAARERSRDMRWIVRNTYIILKEFRTALHLAIARWGLADLGGVWQTDG